MNVFLGFNASNEELKLKAHNIWAFTTNDTEFAFNEYLNMSVEEALVSSDLKFRKSKQIKIYQIFRMPKYL